MAVQKWKKTKYPGVRFREHATNKHGAQKDRYYTITYKFKGKTKTEVIGWASQGNTPASASDLLNQIKKNQREGSGFQTLAEKRELEKAAAQQRKEDERLAKQTKMTLLDVWNEHYFVQAQHNKSKGSWVREESLFRIWISPMLGRKVFSEIGVQDLEKLKVEMLNDGASFRSVEYALAVIRQIFNVMISYDLYKGDNPVSRVKKPKEDNRRTRFLSKEKGVPQALKEKLLCLLTLNLLYQNQTSLHPIRV